ncbi:ribonuclease III [Delitschia confertaspora ATCC 74209]|uniref:Large ribosomal subunit protein mL44 n=1 Tax=Delitschia confertaspora ATCC 74209 TaxID=1513339 RepID=A0A9P4JL73_9PLEO|nr:ribonuclease III [Delitschia confertaspora ATCC 74209]
MKRLRIERWGSQLHPQSTFSSRPRCICPSLQSRVLQPHNRRAQSTAPQIPAEATEFSDVLTQTSPEEPKMIPLETLPSPHPHVALRSAKLSALRSRLSLPPRLPLQSLARTLVHESADSDPNFNNTSLSILGSNILGYYTTEHLIANYPRLPTSVLFAAQYAYVGPKALTTIAHEWGIESAAEPGGEVDPGLLQFKRLRAGEWATPSQPSFRNKWNQSLTGKIVHGDEFGSYKSDLSERSRNRELPGVPLEDAASTFVRALVGATYLHCGPQTTKRFYANHFLSRHLDMSTLFDFRTPTRDLSRLCAREGFEAPIARLISETGRKSRHPVFVVGVFSGKDKLGEGAGSSLNEARVRAAAAALKSWYLYRPVEVTVPSSVEGVDPNSPEGAKWIPNHIDCGEVIV